MNKPTVVWMIFLLGLGFGLNRPALAQEEFCGGIAAIPCSSPNDFCEYPAGLCQVPDLGGVCTPIPVACPAIYDPVCGCDGKTYGNDCIRRMAQVAKDHDGECLSEPEICGGIAGIVCSDPDDFCEYPEGQCLVADPQGVCVDIPDVCPLIYDPVCGCDGETYSNDCFRQMAQVAKDHDGACSNACLNNSDCSPSDYCAKAQGDCGGIGTCEPRPLACPDIFDPVCGCNGMTYSNGCDAQAAGVNVIHDGQCELPECAIKPPVDYNNDCRVTLVDFAFFVSFWLDCGLVPPDACWP